jgi:hypothetical protein
LPYGFARAVPIVASTTPKRYKRVYKKMLKRAREKKSTTFLKKSDYEFGRFSSAQIASAIFVRELLRFA